MPKSVAKERAARLRALGETQFAKLCQSRIGQTENVLVERNGLGRTEHFLPVRVENARPGEIIAVDIHDADSEGLVGTPERIVA